MSTLWTDCNFNIIYSCRFLFFIYIYNDPIATAINFKS